MRCRRCFFRFVLQHSRKNPSRFFGWRRNEQDRIQSAVRTIHPLARHFLREGDLPVTMLARTCHFQGHGRSFCPQIQIKNKPIKAQIEQRHNSLAGNESRTSPPRPESGGFCSGSAPRFPSAPQNRRTHAAPDSSLSLSLKASPFRLLAHRSGYDARSCSARTARLGLRKWATAPLRAFQAERQDIATPAFCPVRPIAPPCRQDLPALASPR